MRFPADSVKQGILHADQDVRWATVNYFADSYSSDPTVMPLVIQAIEKYGFDNAFLAYYFMKEVVHTDESVCWLIRQLGKLGKPTNEKDAEPILAYLQTLVHADPSVLKKHEAEIVALESVDPKSQVAINERIRFPSRSGEELWEDFELFCHRQEMEEFISTEEFDFGCRLVEALGRFRDQFAGEVLEIIRGHTDEIGTWKEGFAIRLSGEMKLEEAIPLMMDTLQELPEDWVSEECHRAFIKMGSEAVIAQFADRYAKGGWFERMSIACTLENIHSDRSVQACFDFLNFEQDTEIRSILFQSILFNFSTDGIEPARRFILDTPVDPDVLEVRSALLTVCKLTGERFPEFDAWLEDSKNDQAFRQKWNDENPLPEEDEDFDDDEVEHDDVEEEEYDEPEPAPLTIVRRNERIGRNDPCPCGSGKKFKKCCYGMSSPEETDTFHASAISEVAPGKSTTKFPVGTVAQYGPNDKITTKIVAGVIKQDGAEPILQRWMGTNIKENPKFHREMQEFFRKHGVKSVVATDGNIGCPHEEGQDFPHGKDCPFCPFWKGKQGSSQKE